MKRSLLTVGLLATTITHAVEAAAKPNIVAVMTIEDRTGVLSPSVVEALTDALRGKLAESGRYVVIDKSRQAAALRKLVREQKRASYKACFDSACQIPLGQALAADKILRTKVTRIGSSYHLAAELVDLAKEAVVGAAQHPVRVRPARTREDRLLGAISVIAYRLAGAAGRRPMAGDAPRSGREQVEPIQPIRPHSSSSGSGSITTAQLRQQQLARQRAAEQQADTARTDSEQRRLRAARFRKLFYGWSAIALAAGSAGLGIYWMTAKVSAEADRADDATSPSEIDQAADAAKSARSTGVVFLVTAGLSAGFGLYMLLTAPAAPQDTPSSSSSGQVELDRMPAGAPLSSGGFALSWGGRF